MTAALLALSLVLSPVRAATSPEKIVADVFRSDMEAVNFSAHVAWSLALPLAGNAVDGKRGTLIAGSAWIAYSLVNEFAFHPPLQPRERALNLVSRLVPCAVVMLVRVLR